MGASFSPWIPSASERLSQLLTVWSLSPTIWAMVGAIIPCSAANRIIWDLVRRRTSLQHVEKVLRKQQPSGRGWHQENTRPEERSSRWMLWVPPIAVVQEPFDILPSCLQYPFDDHFLQTS